MIYKTLLDNLTQGVTDYKSTFSLMGLNNDMALSLGPLQYLERLHLDDCIHHKSGQPGIVTFGKLMDSLRTLIMDLRLPQASLLLLHYQHQNTKQELGMELVVYDQDWVKKAVKKSLEFWLGSRAAQGVDIEEAWKCRTCQFSEVCVWNRQLQVKCPSPTKHHQSPPPPPPPS